jgi:5-methylcytosine-specific restriction protein A
MQKQVNRIRGRKLQEIRKRHFEQFPLCVDCQKQGRITIATELDHIIALTNGGHDFDVDPSQKCGLCHDCHEAKTAKDMGYRPRLAISLDGWPETR